MPLINTAMFRVGLIQRTLLFTLVLLSVGCSSMAHRDEIEPTLEVVEPSAPEQVEQQFLTPDLIFSVLAGEIALQRGELDLAYDHQLGVAALADDVAAAERATRIALHKQDYPRAFKAVDRWVELAPNDLSAHTIAAVIAMHVGDEEFALTHLQRAVTLVEERGEDGMLHAAATLSQVNKEQLALKMMRRLAMQRANSPEAAYALALTAVVAKEYQLAEAEVRKVLKINPKMVKAHVLLARILVTSGDMDGARKVLQSAVNRFPQNTILRTAYARLLLEVGEHEQAYRQFKRLHRMSPDNAEIRLSLAILAIQLERHAVARRHLNALISSEELVDAAFFYLGRSAEIEQKGDQAINWYQQVKQDQDLFVDAQTRIARLYVEQGKEARAHELLQELRQRMPARSIQLYMLEGEILQQTENPEQVLALYAAALQEHPGDSDLLYARSLYGASHGMAEQAERDLLVIIEDDPANADALNALGYILVEHTKRYQEALGYIERALAIKPGSPAILDSMGWAKFRLGKNEEALDYLQRAYGLLQDSEIAAHLGELLWVRGDKVAAQKVWREALQKWPDSNYLLKTMKRLQGE